MRVPTRPATASTALSSGPMTTYASLRLDDSRKLTALRTFGPIVPGGNCPSSKCLRASAAVILSISAARFIVVPEFLDHLRSTFSPDSKISYDQLFESAKNAPVLILDDFGEQTTTPWAREKLYQMINYRYNKLLPTVITTRYSLEEIFEEIESSISSRLVDAKISTPFNITAPDYRGAVQATQKARRPYRRGKKDRWG